VTFGELGAEVDVLLGHTLQASFEVLDVPLVGGELGVAFSIVALTAQLLRLSQTTILAGHRVSLSKCHRGHG